MFTGLVAGLGEVLDATPIADGRIARFTVAAPPGFLDGAVLGASIACAGCCLTAVALDHERARFSVEVSGETLSLTTLGGWRAGTAINLERSLRLGDEMGGHLVSGHVDGLGRLISSREEDGSWRLVFAAPTDLARLIARKGSIAIDGVSLTVNHVEGSEFGVNIIPHTRAVTSLGVLVPGDPVHLEIDMLARYVARLVETGPDHGMAR